MFLALPDHVKHREYIVCDEASELEDELVKKFSLSLNTKLLLKFDVDLKYAPITNYVKFREWLQSTNNNFAEQITSLRQKFAKHKEVKPHDKFKYLALRNIQASMEMALNNWSQCEYVIEQVKDGITVTPLRVDFLSQYIFNYADKVLLMSATIIDPNTFCKTLGIDKFKYIEVDSSFVV